MCSQDHFILQFCNWDLQFFLSPALAPRSVANTTCGCTSVQSGCWCPFSSPFWALVKKLNSTWILYLVANVLTLICSSGAVFPSFCLWYPVSCSALRNGSVFLLFFSWTYFTFDHHVNFWPIQAELFKPQSSEQGFSVAHKSSQFSSLLLVFNLQATLPLIVTCSPVIIHSPVLALWRNLSEHTVCCICCRWSAVSVSAALAA